jgi:phosphoribosylanthranilate isomerase
MRPRVKICCIQDPREAALAVSAGADAIGLVGRGLSGPEVIDDDDRIAAIADTVPPFVSSVLLTREQDPAALAAQVVRCRTTLVQIGDAVVPEAWAAVRDSAPNVGIVQVVHVSGEDAIAEAVRVAPFVDGVLLDSGTPTGPNPVFGGSGATHDWSISARIVEAVDKPVYLAGGLRASNVAEGVARVKPFAIDLCSGVRTDGRLDPEKLADFFAAVPA